jgi:P4 family phage/plasmid primase-like protien
MTIYNSDITDENGRAREDLVREALLATQAVKSFDDQLFMRTDTNIWQPIPLCDAGQKMIRRAFFDPLAQSLISHRLMDTVVDNIATDVRFDSIVDFPTDLVCFQNGELNIYTSEFSEKIMHAYKTAIQCRYLPEATLDDAPTFKKFLQTSLGHDTANWNRLLEAIAYVLSPIDTQKMAVFFIGPSGSGKSVVLRLVQALLPEYSVSTLDLSELGHYNNNSTLYGKTVNISSDINSEGSFDMSFFKRATSNEPVLFSEKYSRSKSGRFSTKLLFAGNAMPNIKAAEIDPFVKRCDIVYFKNAVRKNDINYHLYEELLPEKDVVVTLAFKAAQTGLFKTGRPVPCPDSDAAIRFFKMERDPFGFFLHDCLEARPEDRRILLSPSTLSLPTAGTVMITA